MTEGPYYVDDGDDDGAVFGRSDGKIAFYGATPVVKPTVTAIGTTTSSTGLLETRIARLEAALAALGIVAFE